MNNSIIDLMGQIADLKDDNYKNTLAIAVLIELFIDKGIFTKEEFTQKSRQLDVAALTEFLLSKRPNFVTR